MQVVSVVKVEVVAEADVAPRQRVLPAHNEAVPDVGVVGALSLLDVELVAALDEVTVTVEAHEVNGAHQPVGRVLVQLRRDHHLRRRLGFLVPLDLDPRLEVRQVTRTLDQRQVGRHRVALHELVVAERQVVVGVAEAGLHRDVEQRAAARDTEHPAVVVDVERGQRVVVRGKDREPEGARPRAGLQPVVLQAQRVQLAERMPMPLAREVGGEVVRGIRFGAGVVVVEHAQLDLGAEAARGVL